MKVFNVYEGQKGFWLSGEPVPTMWKGCEGVEPVQKGGNVPASPHSIYTRFFLSL